MRSITRFACRVRSNCAPFAALIGLAAAATRRALKGSTRRGPTVSGVTYGEGGPAKLGFVVDTDQSESDHALTDRFEVTGATTPEPPTLLGAGLVLARRRARRRAGSHRGLDGFHRQR